jgi:hypothetical protein
MVLIRSRIWLKKDKQSDRLKERMNLMMSYMAVRARMRLMTMKVMKCDCIMTETIESVMSRGGIDKEESDYD